MKKLNWKSDVARRVCEETRASDPIEGAMQLAENLTRQCGVNYPGRELARVASFQCAKIEECEMADAGRLIPLPVGDFEFLIQINAAHSRQRKNFSTGHEIGHTLIPDFREHPCEKHDAVVMQWHDEREEEFLCDVMASEILMPRRQFIPRLADCGVTIDFLHELAEEFDASLEATAVNIVRAGLEDVAVIVWTPSYNQKDAAAAQNFSLFDGDENEMFAPARKKFRVKFALGFGEMGGFFFPRKISIEDDSIIAQAAWLLAEDKMPQSRGMAKLRHGRGEQNFYVESRAYPTKNGNEWEPKIVSLIFLEEPVRS